MTGAELEVTVIERVKLRTKVQDLVHPPFDGVRLDLLGIDSMAIISLLVELERDVGLDFDRVSIVTPPRTVADIVQLALRGCGLEERYD